MTKKVLLCILDGFGLGDKNNPHNAFAKAKTPFIDKLIKKETHAFLETSGKYVGLPKNQMGNSEVGHMTIGSGRVIEQNLVRINNLIKDNNLLPQDTLTKIAKSNNIHIIGLFSDGGVHSHIDHIYHIMEQMSSYGKNTYIHAITDGRDVNTNQAITLLSEFEEKIKPLSNVSIATICGRYYAMDRDNRTERTNLAYQLYAEGKGDDYTSIKDAIQDNYNKNITDEFIKPITINSFKGIENNDTVIFANFRSDRMVQIVKSMSKNTKVSNLFTLLDYFNDDNRPKNVQVILEKISAQNTLSEIISNKKLNQFKIAETEKYPHITYFFNGGKEEPYDNEDRIIVPSPKVATYDLKPEMSAFKVLDELLNAMNKNYDFALVNFANCDMVGHTGNFDAAIKAVEYMDKVIEKLSITALKHDYHLLITADHGNIEEMIDKNGKIHTQHTTLPVPFILVSNNDIKLQKKGSLVDIMPTILNLMNIEIPKEITGISLIEKTDL